MAKTRQHIARFDSSTIKTQYIQLNGKFSTTISKKVFCNMLFFRKKTLSDEQRIERIIRKNKIDERDARYVEQFIKNNVNDHSQWSRQCNKLLIAASVSDNANLVTLLLANGADINTLTSLDETPLMLASDNGCTKAALALLHANANVNASNHEGHTALTMACKKGHIDISRALLAQERTTTDTYNNDGNTALLLACSNGHSAIASELLAKGANVNFKNYLKETPLTLASANGHLETTRILLAQKEIDIDATNTGENTALLLACKNGHLAIASELLANGANANHQNNEANTALSLAASNGHVEVTRMLLARKEVNICQGKSALEQATIRNKTGHC